MGTGTKMVTGERVDGGGTGMRTEVVGEEEGRRNGICAPIVSATLPATTQ